jgi:TolB-like protein/Tfp pilus assembly protein PilF
MKRCSRCQRNYIDETLNFCLEDGARLENSSANDFPTVSFPQKSFEEPETKHFQIQSDQKSVSSSDELPSIAVLPFVNMSNDAENEYFCDGLAEELLNALAKIENLKVAARTSTFFFKGKNTNVSEIGNTLNVKTVLEGSVRKAGNRLRITAQLINAADGYHLWSERYDREMQDIFDVQDEITLAIVSVLKVKLLGEEKADVLKRGTDNTEAYELYLKGRYYANKFTLEGFDKALLYLNKAIEKDPKYALAYAGIAHAYFYASTVHLPPAKALLEMKAAASKALELDDSVGEAHTLLALAAAYYDRNPREAHANFKRGIELVPNDVSTHQWYSVYLAMTGRFDEAISELKRAQELDPLSTSINMIFSWTYYLAQQSEKVIEKAHKALEIDENFWMARWSLALGYEQMGQYAEAIEELKKARALDESPWISALLARVYARSGQTDEARRILEELTEKSKQQWVAPYLIATAYHSLNERDQAFRWLHTAFADYDEWTICLNNDPALDELHSDPRFQDLLRRIGLPQ